MGCLSTLPSRSDEIRAPVGSRLQRSPRIILSKLTVVSASVKPRLRLSLVATELIEEGEVVLRCSPEEVQVESTWRTLQLGFARHLKNELLDFMDHSCAPNVGLDVDTLEFKALRPIEPGTAITLFYPGAEVELAQGFDCHCGAAACLGLLRGGFYLTTHQMRWAIDKGYCTRFMREQFARLLTSA